MSIKPDTALAAANENNNLRVYYQDSEGWIHEATFAQGVGWSNGEKVVQADPGSPIAVAFVGVNKYAYDGNNWFQGSLSGFNFAVLPASNLAARYVDGEPRVYAQVDGDGIHEYRHANNAWRQAQDFGAGLYSTDIAATGTGKFRLFFQENNGTIVEWVYEGDAWTKGEYTYANALAEGPIAAVSFDEEYRVYHLNPAWSIVESLNAPGSNSVQTDLEKANAKSKLACLGFTNAVGQHVRVYCQDEEGGKTITEHVYDGVGWRRQVILPV